jgi:hypothetical protein
MMDPANRETVREFIITIAAQAKAALAGIENPGYLQMSRLHPTSEKLVPNRYRLDDVERMVRDAITDCEAGHNVYIEGRTIREDAERGGRGKLSDTAWVFALVIDNDADKGMGWTPPAANPPSMSVETSPGNSQDWLFLRKAISARLGQQLGECIRKSTGTDHDTGNVVQPYRVAGTANYPNKKKCERGRVTVATRLVEFDPETLWTPKLLLKAFPRAKIKPNGGSDPAGGGAQPDEGNIPADTLRIIRNGVEKEFRSDAFFGVVWTLKARGWTLDHIVALLEKYHGGIASKYLGRLQHEVERIYHKLDQGRQSGPQAAAASGTEIAVELAKPAPPAPADPRSRWIWYGEVPAEEARKWLVANLLPETGAALISGQWGSFKTFLALDLACAVMTGGDFIKYPVMRRGGVLLLACEGQNEVAIRIRAAYEARGGEGNAPFAWQETSPRLLDPGAEAQLVAQIKAGAEEMQRKFGLPVALVIIDAIGKAAGYSKPGDENDAALAKIIMGVLGAVSRQTKTLVTAIAHFGKHAETGTRGSSGYEDDADVVLAALAEKAMAGTVANTRLAARKSRAGPSGEEYPFRTKHVDMGVDEIGIPLNTLTIEWIDAAAAPWMKPAQDKDPWRRKSLRTLRQTLMNVLVDHGKEVKPWPNGPSVRAVDIEIVRSEFYRAHPAAEATDATDKAQARRKAFKRAIDDAKADNLIGTWEIEGITYVWPVGQTRPQEPGAPEQEAEDKD